MTDPDHIIAEPIAQPEDAPASGLTDWALRPWLLAGVLALSGAVIYFVTDGYRDDEPWRAAVAAFALFGGLAFAFTVDEERELRAALFGLVGGLVMAGIAYRTASAGDGYSDAPFWVAAGILALALALPLFQAGFLQHRWNTPYRATHFHVWTDALSAAGALAFTGLSWALLAILGALFDAIEISVLYDLMKEGLFAWMFSGAAFGGALGVLRNQRRVLGTVQHVALLVLSILAVPFAAGLTLFLLALIVSGPQILWNATESATPLLLACAAGCFVLANAILRDDDPAMSENGALRWAARVLAALILPLTVFAAVSIGTRIAQYGLSPERIWALIAIAVATAYGLAYAVSLARGWKSGTWRDTLRQANLHLAAGTSVIALLLALPILDFGAVSTRDQLARLESGAVSVEAFDFDALKWDFGDAGRAALARMAQSNDETIAAEAKAAMAVDSRWNRFDDVNAERARTGKLVVYPEGTDLPDSLRKAVLAPSAAFCFGNATCRIYVIDDVTAVAIEDGCSAEGLSDQDKIEPEINCSIGVEVLTLRNGEWVSTDAVDNPPELEVSSEEEKAMLAKERRAIESGNVQVRDVVRRQLFIGDKPINDPFE